MTVYKPLCLLEKRLLSSSGYFKVKSLRLQLRLQLCLQLCLQLRLQLRTLNRRCGYFSNGEALTVQTPLGLQHIYIYVSSVHAPRGVTVRALAFNLNYRLANPHAPDGCRSEAISRQWTVFNQMIYQKRIYIFWTLKTVCAHSAN